MNESPFKSGARVAIYGRYSRNEVHESFVDKVYKNGNFTLRGSPQQWRPSGLTFGRWYANETGSEWTHVHLILWDEAADAEIKEKIVEAKLKQRWRDIRFKIDRLRKHPDETVCDAIEAALALVKP